jgi:hypothetical protein
MARRPGIALVAAGVAAASALVVQTPASATPQQSELARARAATAAFHDPDKAIEAGYLRNEHCDATADGVMGQHWVNPDLFTADANRLDPTRPQVLLYVPTADGLRLVAAEWLLLAPAGTQPAQNPNQVDAAGPKIFGQHFNGPMAGHTENMPVHWDLHVWLWAHNAKGMFAQYNPSLSC